MKNGSKALLIGLGTFAICACGSAKGSKDAVTRVPVEISGGHDTDGRDRGRPVILVAGALGVPAKVFREAFTHVHPAPPGMQPTPEEARANKGALLAALGKYGITNERLDTVSNYYRYVRSRGELWPTKPATVNALVRNGMVIGFEVVNGGSGYSSVPTLSVPNAKLGNTYIRLKLSKSFESNGSIVSITISA